MPLVQMIGADGKAERLQRALSTNAENDLLSDAVGLVASIQPLRDRPVGWLVFAHIGIEQNDRDLAS